MISCRGRHNRIKALSFIVMVHEGEGVPSWYLAQLVGVAHNKEASIRTLLARWCRWRYVKVWIAADGTRLYSIMPRGEEWLQRHWGQIAYSLVNDWLPGFWRADYYDFLFDKPKDDVPKEADKRMRGHRRKWSDAEVEISE